MPFLGVGLQMNGWIRMEEGGLRMKGDKRWKTFHTSTICISFELILEFTYESRITDEVIFTILSI